MGWDRGRVMGGSVRIGSVGGPAPGVAALDVHEPAEDGDELEGLVQACVGVVDEGVKLEAEEGDLIGEVVGLDGVVEFMGVVGGNELGVEAVPAGVLVAGLACGVAFWPWALLLVDSSLSSSEVRS